MNILAWLRGSQSAPDTKPYPNQFRAKIIIKYKGRPIHSYKQHLHAKDKKHARDIVIADIQQHLTYGVETFAD